MLTGAAIEVSSTPLPRAVPLTPGAAGRGGGGGSGNNIAAASSSDVEARHRSSWQQQQELAVAAAAEKKDIAPVHTYQPEEPLPSPKCAATAGTVGVGRAGSGVAGNNNNTHWNDNKRRVPEGTVGDSTTAAPTSADRSWRASYASSLYCLLPAWLLRFRGPAYSPLRDDACGSAASSTRAASPCCGSNTAAAGGSAAAGGGGGAAAETNFFGDAPFSTVCLHCHKAVITTVAFKISCLGICLCLLSPLLLGWPGLCLSPFIYIALKDAVHTCPQCRNLIHRQSRISVPFFGLRDEVVTVKCGNCAVVLSRRYLLLFAALLLFILLFYILRAGWLGGSLDLISKGPPANLSWKQFYEQCGQRSQLGNSLKAGANFRELFAGKTVEWKGLVKQVKEGFFTSNVLLVVMSPTITLSGGGGQNSPAAGEAEPNGRNSGDESGSTTSSEEKAGSFITEKKGATTEGGIRGHTEDDSNSSASEQGDEDDLEEEAKAMQGDGADLALAFSGSELIKQVEKLEPGDRIEFEATLVALGRRGKPSLGRLWSVSMVEKREVREARLEEWRAKKAQRQHLLQRLLLPLVGSPFSDFSFDPISSFFSSTGGLGGSGVMVIRRQIISPTASFSVISSASEDEPTNSIPSIFGGSGRTSLESIHTRGHEDEDERPHFGKDTEKYGIANDFTGFGEAIRGPLITEKHYSFVGKAGDDHSGDGEQMVFHIDEEDDEEHLKEGTTGEIKFGHRQHAEDKAHRPSRPAWSVSSGSEEADNMHEVDVRHRESHDSGLYFHLSDDEDDEHHSAFGGKAREARGSAARGSEGANIDYEKDVKLRQSHESDPGDEEANGADPTLAALKLAVEHQRQRRAEQEKQSKQQRQQQAHQSTRNKEEHAKRRASVSNMYTAIQAENVRNQAPSQQDPSRMHGEKKSDRANLEDAVTETQAAHPAYIPAPADVQHEQEEQAEHLDDVHSGQRSTAYLADVAGEDVAHTRHGDERPSAGGDAGSAAAAESSSSQP